MSLSEKQVDRLMKEIPEGWKNRWCTARICGCLGCANGSGKGTMNGMSKQNWEDWKRRNHGENI